MEIGPEFARNLPYLIHLKILPYQIARPWNHGIEKDKMRVPDYASRFNLQTNLLGPRTAYHESLCYSHTRIDDSKAMAIGSPLGLLVDRAKAGIKFDMTFGQSS